MLNLFISNVQDAGGVESMHTLDRMKVLVSFTSLLVMQPHRKVRSAWTVSLARLYRVLMHL